MIGAPAATVRPDLARNLLLHTPMERVQSHLAAALSGLVAASRGRLARARRHWTLVWHLTRQDLLDRYAGSVLGGLWTFIQPLLQMLVFILVFSQLMRARLPEATGAHSYSVYLIAGLLGWTAFSSTLMRTTTMFLDQAGIIRKTPVDLAVFPAAILLCDGIIYLISLTLFGGYLLLIQHPLSMALAWVLVVFAVQQAFAAGLGLVVGTLGVFLRDLREAVAVILQLWFWLTPIVYVASILAPPIQTLMGLNPLYPIMDAYHRAVLTGEVANGGALILLLLLALALLALGRWLLRRLEGDIRDLV